MEIKIEIELEIEIKLKWTNISETKERLIDL